MIESLQSRKFMPNSRQTRLQSPFPPRFLPKFPPPRAIGAALAGQFLLLQLLLGVGAPVCAAKPGLPPTVQAALKQAHIPPQAMAAFVQQVDARRSLLAEHAEQPMQPASVIKLVTSYVALEQFGPAQRWKTSFYSNAPLVNGVLQGDLVLQGGGDPKLVLESLWQFLRQLRQQGVRDIQGNLVLDRSLFQGADIDTAQFDGDPARAYNVGPDALLLNFKSIRLRFETDGEQVRVVSEPALDGITITPPQAGNGECVDWHEQLQFVWQERQLQIGGNYPKSCGTRQWAVHPFGLSANQYAGALFQSLWRELGGSFAGNVVDGTVPPDARLLGQWESPALSEMIRDMNKFSNNVMARQLLILLAAKAPGDRGDVAVAVSNARLPAADSANQTVTANPAAAIGAAPAIVPAGNAVTVPAPATTPAAAQAGLPAVIPGAAPALTPALTPAKGARALQRWLREHDLSDPQLVLENGAGLSHQEQLSAKGLARILLAAYHSPWMPEFVASLPVVAYDGTMKKRLQETPVAGQAHIKTGTLNGVRSIAGYVRAKSGKIWVVTSLINHANAGKGQAVHDALLQWIFDKG